MRTRRTRLAELADIVSALERQIADAQGDDEIRAASNAKLYARRLELAILTKETQGGAA